ncbi:MAG: BolA family protein [Pseudomonadota bacterium]
MKVEQQIFDILHQNFPDATLEITNESHKHQGHAQTPATGESHFAVQIASQKFQNLNRVERHRLIYAALNELMPDPIHALKIKAATHDGQEKHH